MIFLASDVRPPRGGADDALLRLAAETGADGVHLAGGCDLELYARLAGTALRLGVGVPSLALPLPERPLPAGRRLPRLSAHARDEREAAIALRSRGLEAAATVAARFAVLDFGEVTLAARPGELASGVCPPRDGRGRARRAGCWRRPWRSGARARRSWATPAAGRWSAWCAGPSAPG